MYRPVRVRTPYAPVAPRMPRQAATYGYSAYPYPQYMAGRPGAYPGHLPAYSRRAPVYPMPPRFAAAPWLPYPGFNPMLPPPMPMHPWQGVRSHYGMSDRSGFPGYPRSRNTPQAEQYLAGCPDC